MMKGGDRYEEKGDCEKNKRVCVNLCWKGSGWRQRQYFFQGIESASLSSLACRCEPYSYGVRAAIDYSKIPAQGVHVGEKWDLSRKLKSRYGARNRFQEPILELSSQAT